MSTMTATAPERKTTARVRFGGLREHAGLGIASLLLFAILALTAPNFATSTNLLNLLRDVSFVGIIAFGMTFVIIAAEIDISVGSAMAFASALLGSLHLDLGLPLLVSVPLVLAVGAAIGAVAGFLRAKAKVPSFIVTLALFTALSGAALMMTNALPRPIDSDLFRVWGGGSMFGVPVPAILMVVAFFVFWFLSKRTVFGRSIYAVGGNEAAAHLSGISVSKIRISIFAITGLLAAFSGLLLSSRLGTSNASLGGGVEFAVISAVIVGGASLYGGRGSMVGTLLGVIFIGMLTNGMVLLGVNSYAQGIAQGVIVVAAVLVSTYFGGESTGRKSILGVPLKLPTRVRTTAAGDDG